MGRWSLVPLVVMMSAAAWAEPAPSVADNAATSAHAAESQVAQSVQRRGQLAKRYQDELEAIDRLKQQRASWRRDRELRDSMSSSLETANQLAAASRALEDARANLVINRRNYLIAIDAELAMVIPSSRRSSLERDRRLLLPQLKDAPHRIVLPDMEIDPLADPEELDQRAAELRATEDELAHEMTGLSTQATELDHLAQLRKQHDRAGDLFNRDDDEPHRAARKADGSEEATAPSSSDPTHLPTQPVWTGGSYENYVPIVLADVIDASTMSTVSAAERSGDPARRAAAAHKAYEAVAKRVAEVRKKRAEIESRANQLRSAH